MSRLTRSQSQEQTRQRLIDAARELFRRDGFAATSIDRIAEAAGYSKGAVYSNFACKEEIFLAALQAEGAQSMAKLLEALHAAPDTATLIDLLADWADARAGSGNWALTIMEYARQAENNAEALCQQEKILRACWQQLGACLLPRLPDLARRAGHDAQMVGALLFELAHAPALAHVDSPRPGALVRLVLGAAPAAEQG
ncbi:MAG TPA: helix-turn-helix domain-containing protein [Novosphingobium sp.]|nr:helix-turn-helix domain-containing protein [Novosphingobium sp.]